MLNAAGLTIREMRGQLALLEQQIADKDQEIAVLRRAQEQPVEG